MFTAPWCKPCKGIKPVFEELCRSSTGVFLMVDVNDEDLEPVARECEIGPLPTFQKFVKAQRTGIVQGALEADLRALVQKE
mmetsp:Transcript_33476/g.78440  ORF Transcript_33476/g.78440 Transcript_33476/m.78440 type:complete len:81 (+) Transcript_33476:330-572(+)